MASDLRYSMGQYLMLAIYNTVAEWEVETIDAKLNKYENLVKIKDIITGHEQLKDLI